MDTSRDGERQLARSICGIRWTPDESRVHARAYYAWIVEGLALFAALTEQDVELIEVFPTASWTRWYGDRGRRSRSAWSQQALVGLGLRGVPARTNQDQRDAIAAAVTARQHTQGLTETMGDIVVPVARETIASDDRRTLRRDDALLWLHDRRGQALQLDTRLDFGGGTISVVSVVGELRHSSAHDQPPLAGLVGDALRGKFIGLYSVGETYFDVGADDSLPWEFSVRLEPRGSDELVLSHGDVELVIGPPPTLPEVGDA